MSDTKKTVNDDHTITKTHTNDDGSGHSETVKPGILVDTVVSEETWNKHGKPEDKSADDKAKTK